MKPYKACHRKAAEIADNQRVAEIYTATRREPLVLTGRVQPTATYPSRHVTIGIPAGVDRDTYFEYTLREVIK